MNQKERSEINPLVANMYLAEDRILGSVPKVRVAFVVYVTEA